jgi:all-trans-retinol 13,14-reductase
MVPRHDTIVIGGGVAGLACALLRARHGERVVVVEQSAHLSPALYGFVRQGAYVDSGFHYVGSMAPDGLTRHLLEELGLAGTLEGTVAIPDTVDHVRFLKPAFDFRFPQGWEALEGDLGRAFPAEGEKLRTFLAQVRSLWEQSRALFLRDHGQGPGSPIAIHRDWEPHQTQHVAFGSPRGLGTFFLSAGRSLQEALDDGTSNPVLRGLLSSHGILYGAAPQETSLLFHSQIVGSYYESSCLIRGGGRTWVEAFEKALGEAGVELLCGRKVSRLCLDEQRRFSAVELDTGVRLPAVRCISTIHPKLLLEMTPPNAFSPAYRRRIRELEETPSAVVLYGRCPSVGFAGNLIVAGRPQETCDWMHLPIEERPLFISSPVDKAGVSVICPARLAEVPDSIKAAGEEQRSAQYQDWKTRLAERLMKRLSSCAHDLLDGFELLDVATPLTFRDRLASPEGGLYGVKHRLVDMPLLPRTSVPGLYLSGQAVVAPGVLGVLCASFLTESCITE